MSRNDGSETRALVESPRNRGHALEGGVAFITGGASGIGEACVEVFAGAGSAVMVADRDVERGEALVSALVGRGVEAGFARCDVRDATSVQDAVDSCVAQLGGLDFAVNSAGVGGTPTSAPLASMAVEAFDEIIAINLRGAFLSTRAELDVMARQGWGSIVNLASAAGLVGVKSSAAYSASKHGVIGLTKSAALDYAEVGIRVNAICPGMIATPLTDAGMPPEYHQLILAAHPMRRVGIADEVASAALWLCGPGSTFTTGATLSIDGGMTST